MNEGRTVSHAEFGRGTVIEDDPHRRRVRVDFGWMQDWVSYNEAGLRDHCVVEGRPTDTTGLGGTAPGGLPNNVVDARRAILALKLGQVLKKNVAELSTGTDDIQRVLEEKAEATAGGQPGSILFKGSWGSGKTHLLTLLAALAAERRLATTSVILDGEAVRLSEPMSLMRSILGSLCYPDELVPGSVIERLREFRRRHGGSSAEIQRGASWRIRTAVLETPMRAFDEPEVADILDEYLTMSIPATTARERLRNLGHRAQLPAMNARRVDERVERFCELLGGWAEICTLTGARGLVVVFDEVDVEYGSTLGQSREAVKRRGLRSALLEALSRPLNPNRHTPLLIAFGSAPATDDVGEANDAVLDIRRSIRDIVPIEAPTPNLAQTRELGRCLLDLYLRAYPDQDGTVDRHELEQRIDNFALEHQHSLSPIPRAFVRGTLERLDVVSCRNDGNTHARS